ncbi:MAG: STAS domain-containing protein [Candidatus Tumulicola sp.]
MRTGPAIDVVVLAGELDIARKEELHRALVIGPAARGILLDLSDVTYADSTALTELLRFRRHAEQRTVPVALVVAQAQFDRVIRYAGLYEVFEIFGSRNEALAYLESAA